jgi:homogentisate phytyltransferase/homogentisate geranylgeranyltransferase
MSRISPQPSITKPSLNRQLDAFWKFSRPHTIVGTTLSVFGLFLIALAENRALSSTIYAVLLTLLACLCGNVYIVGLNQLEDVAIDQINKPHLPIAAGEFSRKQAAAIVVITGILAIGIALTQSVYLFSMVSLSLAIGTAYSLPPIRLKRFPIWASLCIFTVRGVVVNLGLFLHFHNGLPIPPSVWALTLFVLVFTFAIAIFKDIPDMEGDRQHNITTFTLRLGQQRVFNLALSVLTVCYLGMILAGAIGLPGVNATFLMGTHWLSLAALWLRRRTVDLADKRAISRFYQFIWKLFFLEYLIFPIACLLAAK